jgi:hypothetical protein
VQFACIEIEQVGSFSLRFEGLRNTGVKEKVGKLIIRLDSDRDK